MTKELPATDRHPLATMPANEYASGLIKPRWRWSEAALEKISIWVHDILVVENMENRFERPRQFKDTDSEVRWMLEQGSIKSVIERLRDRDVRDEVSDDTWDFFLDRLTKKREAKRRRPLLTMRERYRSNWKNELRSDYYRYEDVLRRGYGEQVSDEGIKSMALRLTRELDGVLTEAEEEQLNRYLERTPNDLNHLPVHLNPNSKIIFKWICNPPWVVPHERVRVATKTHPESTDVFTKEESMTEAPTRLLVDPRYENLLNTLALHLETIVFDAHYLTPEEIHAGVNQWGAVGHKAVEEVIARLLIDPRYEDLLNALALDLETVTRLSRTPGETFASVDQWRTVGHEAVEEAIARYRTKLLSGRAETVQLSDEA